MAVLIKPGDVFGRLTVKELAVGGNANQRKWLCVCECGKCRKALAEYADFGKQEE